MACCTPNKLDHSELIQVGCKTMKIAVCVKLGFLVALLCAGEHAS